MSLGNNLHWPQQWGNWECCIYYYLYSMNLMFGIQFLFGKKWKNGTKIKLPPVSLAKKSQPHPFKNITIWFSLLPLLFLAQPQLWCPKHPMSTQILPQKFLTSPSTHCFPSLPKGLPSAGSFFPGIVSVMFSEPLKSFGHSPLFFPPLAVTQSIPPSFLRSSNTFCHQISKKNANSL